MCSKDIGQTFPTSYTEAAGSQQEFLSTHPLQANTHNPPTLSKYSQPGMVKGFVLSFLFIDLEKDTINTFFISLNALVL